MDNFRLARLSFHGDHLHVTKHSTEVRMFLKERKMNTHVLALEDLVRKAVIEVAQLPENELVAVIEMVGALKEQRARPNRALAKEIVARARARAAEMSHLSHEEVVQRFTNAMDRIRAEAIAKGTAIEGEWEGD
jgi:hypothetical protein